MTFYLAGGEAGAFTPLDSSFVENATGYDSAFARGSMRGLNSTSAIRSAATSLPDDFWIHFEHARSGDGTDDSYPLVLSTATTEVFRLNLDNATNLAQMQALISSVWTNIGGTFSFTVDNLNTFDIHVTGNSATGEAKLYVNGTRVVTASSVNLSAVVDIVYAKSYGVDTIKYTFLSQFIAADEPTVGLKLGTIYASGAGATNTFVGGAYTDIDELAYSDADFAYADTNGQIFLVAGTSVATMTNKVVRAVVVTSRAKCGAGGPQNMQHVVRVSGADYVSSTIGLDVGYDSYCSVWATNPATGVAWTVADLASPQFGVKAIT